MIALSIQELSARYGTGSKAITAVDGVSLNLPVGSSVGLVGESGSGKSTLAKAVVGLAPVVEGRVVLQGQDVTDNNRAAREARRRIQLVFQDPASSLDPRMTVGESLAEAVASPDRAHREAEVARLLELVSLDPALQVELPRHLSGGQQQRVAICRALGANPEVLIADEVTSSLDVSVQGSILNMLRELQRELGFTMLFISHNLAVVRYLCDAIAVMYLGRIVEIAPTEQVISSPQHPYTRMLLDSVPGSVSTDGAFRPPIVADPPDPGQPPTGCRFHPRCPVGPEAIPSRTVCRTDDPSAEAASRVNSSACHFAPRAGGG